MQIDSRRSAAPARASAPLPTPRPTPPPAPPEGPKDRASLSCGQGHQDSPGPSTAQDLVRGLQQNFKNAEDASEAVSRATRVASSLGSKVPALPSLPSHPSTGLMGVLPQTEGLKAATPTGLTSAVHEKVMPATFDKVNDALTGRPSTPTDYLGSSTRTGTFSPKVNFAINGENVTVRMPAVPKGRSVDYYRTRTPEGQGIQARSGDDRWNLQYRTHAFVPDVISGLGWEWARVK